MLILCKFFAENIAILHIYSVWTHKSNIFTEHHLKLLTDLLKQVDD